MITPRWHQSIQFKLQLFISMIFILSMGSILAANYYNTKKNLELSLKNEMESRYAQFSETINSSAVAATNMALWVANSKDIQAAFEQRDRDRLKELTLPIYEKLKTEINLSQFQFHLPPAVSFLRLHAVDKFGDDLSKVRPTIVAANTTLKSASGLDYGVFGLGIRGVTPVFSGSQHIGSVEFGLSLNDKFLERLKSLYGTQIAIVLKNTEKNDFQIHSKNFEFSNPKEFSGDYDSVIGGNGFKFNTRVSNGQDLCLLLGPLKDFSGKIEGVVVIEKDITSQMANLTHMLLFYSLAAVIFLILILGVLYLIFRIVLKKRIQSFSKIFKKSANGDLTARYISQNSDEMSVLGETLNDFIISVQKIFTDLKKDNRYLKESSVTLDSISRLMNERAASLSGSTSDLDRGAKETSDNVNSIAAAIEQTNMNMESISKKVAVLSRSLHGISKDSSSARNISSHAAEGAKEILSRMTLLENLIKDIDKITETITGISDQINLLALNATIESARAGEAGKGFAVVSAEIKSLAHETGGATKDIKVKIETIRHAMQDSIGVIKGITDIIHDADRVVKKISEDIIDQSAGTAEIANNSEQACLGINEISKNAAVIRQKTLNTSESIALLNQATGEIESVSQNIRSDSGKMNSIADAFESLIEKFTI